MIIPLHTQWWLTDIFHLSRSSRLRTGGTRGRNWCHKMNNFLLTTGLNVTLTSLTYHYSNSESWTFFWICGWCQVMTRSDTLGTNDIAVRGNCFGLSWVRLQFIFWLSHHHNPIARLSPKCLFWKLNPKIKGYNIMMNKSFLRIRISFTVVISELRIFKLGVWCRAVFNIEPCVWSIPVVTE